MVRPSQAARSTSAAGQVPVVEFVAARQIGHVGIPRDSGGAGWRRELVMRPTDAFVQDQLRLVPLSVSADRIAHVAVRCAVSCWRSLTPQAAPWIVPDLALRLRSTRPHRCAGGAWITRGYKQPARPDVLGHLVGDLLTAAPWLDCGSHGEAIRRSQDVLDAVIAAMTARAAAQSQTSPSGEANLIAVRTEGWIAIPDSPISQLP
jgi:hypothetical protein